MTIKFKSQAAHTCNLCVNTLVKARYNFLNYSYYKGLKQQKWPSASVKVIGNRAIQ